LNGFTAAALRGIHEVTAMNQKPLTTEDLAEKLGIKPQSIRSALCRNGSYYGLQPAKMPNRFLLWPSDSLERLTNGQIGGAAK
jgi:hypothetical protein